MSLNFYNYMQKKASDSVTKQEVKELKKVSENNKKIYKLHCGMISFKSSKISMNSEYALRYKILYFRK